MLDAGQTEEAPLAFAFSPELQNSVQTNELQDFNKCPKAECLHCVSLNGIICILSNNKLADHTRFGQSIMFKPCFICLAALTFIWLQEKHTFLKCALILSSYPLNICTETPGMYRVMG